MMEKRITVGRSKENNVVLSESSVSRFHLEILKDEEGRVFVKDLNSTNGTTVNGTRVHGIHELRSTDILIAGKAEIIPWESYFAFSEKDEKKQKLVTVISPPKSGNNNVIKYLVVSISFVFVAVVLLLLRDDIFDNNSDTKAEYVDGVLEEEGTSTTIETHRDDRHSQTSKNQPLPTNKEIKYDYSCMDNALLNDLNDLESEFVAMFDESVSLSEETDVGKQLYQGCLDEYKFIYDHRYQKINSIKNKLDRSIKNKRGFNYKIYLIQSEEINAFTAGGYIFVTTAMYHFAENDDELACVIGHEMAHNECKHINHQLKKQKVNQNLFGEFFGSAADALGFFLTSGFNQKNETECDFHGIDYAVNAGFNGCEVIGLWERMSKQETKGDEIEAMMRSHPYSANRSVCCRNHIESNYGYNCPNN